VLCWQDYCTGGSRSHRTARNVFYNNANGVILMHDLTNRKTMESLKHWLDDILAYARSERNAAAGSDMTVHSPLQVNVGQCTNVPPTQCIVSARVTFILATIVRV
jgi:GTPase SAR1 family protein